MILEPEDARRFIDGYKKLLLEVSTHTGGDPNMPLLQRLNAGRNAMFAQPPLRDAALAALKARNDAIAYEIADAARSLRVAQWIYLKDTRSYSVFLHPSEKDAYAVIGLTERIRDLIGGIGALFTTGVVEFRGRYVCDGLISGLAWLEPNYKREFTETFREIKEAGGFHKDCST